MQPEYLFLLSMQVVLLEMIIDPTCSIVLERGPAETDVMDRKPRNINENIVDKSTLFKSILQGLVIFASSFSTYYILLESDVLLARTMGLLIIIVSNFFLVQVISSEYDYAFNMVTKLLKDKLIVFINLILLVVLFVILYTPIRDIFKLTSLSIKNILLVVVISFISVFWYEIIKMIKRKYRK